jgi:excisionase family DNA binding protein
MTRAILISSYWLKPGSISFVGQSWRNMNGRRPPDLNGEGIRLQIGIRSYRVLKFWNRYTDTSVGMNNDVSTATAIQADEGSAREGEILTVMEVARFLRVPKSTVYKLARVGELPASKIGKHWRFLRRDIHEWMHSRCRQG